MEYVPIFLEWLEVTQDLSFEEKGRLIDAVISYAAGTEYADLLQGQEKIAFRFLKGQVDRNRVISEKRSKAGSNKPKQNETNENKTEQNGTNLLKEKKKEKEKEKEKKKEEKIVQEQLYQQRPNTEHRIDDTPEWFSEYSKELHDE